MKAAFAAVAVVTVIGGFKIGLATGAVPPAARPVIGDRGSAVGTPRIDADARRSNSDNGAAPESGLPTPESLPTADRRSPPPGAHATTRTATPTAATLNGVVDEYCADCHNADMLLGNLSLEGYDIARADTARAISEKMIRKLRAGMMPLPGRPRPTGDTLRMVADAIERTLDRVTRPDPGARTFQRLNRAEYERVIHDLLGLDVNAGEFLPLDAKSHNFDNIADAQLLSPTLLESYLNAAAAVSRMAVGDVKAPVTMHTYRVSPYVSQHPWERAEGAPFGTRGGIVARHTFVADGEYELRFIVAGGVGTLLEDLDVSVDGERVALVHYEPNVNPTMSAQDLPLGVDLYRTQPIRVRAGPHRVSVAFVRRNDGPYEDLIKPHDWSLASGGSAAEGTTMPPHLLELSILGPHNATGVSETPSRKIVFSCRPSEKLAARACAEQILTRVGTRAYRRPLDRRDVDGLMQFYDRGAKDSFEDGVRLGLQAVLSSPHFVFRFEQTPPDAAPGSTYRISDVELATRLSFFLWSSIPDERLLSLAASHQLSKPDTLAREVKRMLANPRAEALATRFAGQWLRLQDIEKVRPDVFWFPDYDDQLGRAMRRETELFFGDLVARDRSVLTLLTADHTFVNERLARHYEIPNVSGEHFRKVTYPDSTRRGILGHGSMLVQTSLANRTSPVLRGKWVMEVLIGMPPPPPPPNVPSLDETEDGKDGRPLTTRERMELHRKQITCRTCHQYMDPIGLALDNFDVTGRWRYRENAMPLDTRGELWDGSPVSTPAELSRALIRMPTPFLRAFTENLMAYALGRRVEDTDQPTVRAIVKSAEAGGYRFSAFVNGVVNSPAFRLRRAEAATVADDDQRR
jgi:hypothetical protein